MSSYVVLATETVDESILPKGANETVETEKLTTTEVRNDGTIENNTIYSDAGDVVKSESDCRDWLNEKAVKELSKSGSARNEPNKRSNLIIFSTPKSTSQILEIEKNNTVIVYQKGLIDFVRNETNQSNVTPRASDEVMHDQHSEHIEHSFKNDILTTETFDSSSSRRTAEMSETDCTRQTFFDDKRLPQEKVNNVPITSAQCSEMFDATLDSDSSGVESLSSHSRRQTGILEISSSDENFSDNDKKRTTKRYMKKDDSSGENNKALQRSTRSSCRLLNDTTKSSSATNKISTRSTLNSTSLTQQVSTKNGERQAGGSTSKINMDQSLHVQVNGRRRSNPNDIQTQSKSQLHDNDTNNDHTKRKLRSSSTKDSLRRGSARSTLQSSTDHRHHKETSRDEMIDYIANKSNPIAGSKKLDDEATQVRDSHTRKSSTCILKNDPVLRGDDESPVTTKNQKQLIQSAIHRKNDECVTTAEKISPDHPSLLLVREGSDEDQETEQVTTKGNQKRLDCIDDNNLNEHDSETDKDHQFEEITYNSQGSNVSPFQSKRADDVDEKDHTVSTENTLNVKGILEPIYTDDSIVTMLGDKQSMAIPDQTSLDIVIDMDNKVDGTNDTTTMCDNRESYTSDIFSKTNQNDIQQPAHEIHEIQSTPNTSQHNLVNICDEEVDEDDATGHVYYENEISMTTKELLLEDPQPNSTDKFPSDVCQFTDLSSRETNFANNITSLIDLESNSTTDNLGSSAMCKSILHKATMLQQSLEADHDSPLPDLSQNDDAREPVKRNLSDPVDTSGQIVFQNNDVDAMLKDSSQKEINSDNDRDQNKVNGIIVESTSNSIEPVSKSWSRIDTPIINAETINMDDTAELDQSAIAKERRKEFRDAVKECGLDLERLQNHLPLWTKETILLQLKKKKKYSDGAQSKRLVSFVEALKERDVNWDKMKGAVGGKITNLIKDLVGRTLRVDVESPPVINASQENRCLNHHSKVDTRSQTPQYVLSKDQLRVLTEAIAINGAYVDILKNYLDMKWTETDIANGIEYIRWKRIARKISWQPDEIKRFEKAYSLFGNDLNRLILGVGTRSSNQVQVRLRFHMKKLNKNSQPLIDDHYVNNPDNNEKSPKKSHSTRKAKHKIDQKKSVTDDILKLETQNSFNQSILLESKARSPHNGTETREIASSPHEMDKKHQYESTSSAVLKIHTPESDSDSMLPDTKARLSQKRKIMDDPVIQETNGRSPSRKKVKSRSYSTYVIVDDGSKKSRFRREVMKVGGDIVQLRLALPDWNDRELEEELRQFRFDRMSTPWAEFEIALLNQGLKKHGCMDFALLETAVGTRSVKQIKSLIGNLKRRKSMVRLVSINDKDCWMDDTDSTEERADSLIEKEFDQIDSSSFTRSPPLLSELGSKSTKRQKRSTVRTTSAKISKSFSPEKVGIIQKKKLPDHDAVNSTSVKSVKSEANNMDYLNHFSIHSKNALAPHISCKVNRIQNCDTNIVLKVNHNDNGNEDTQSNENRNRKANGKDNAQQELVNIEETKNNLRNNWCIENSNLPFLTCQPVSEQVLSPRTGEKDLTNPEFSKPSPIINMPYYIEELSYLYFAEVADDDKLQPLPEAEPLCAFPSSIWTFDETSRVLYADFRSCTHISVDDKRFLAQMMQRDDVTVISDGLLKNLDANLWSLNSIENAFSGKPYHKFRRFNRVLRCDGLSTYIEQDKFTSMMVSDYIRYIKIIQSGDEAATNSPFSYRDADGVVHEISRLSDVVFYMIDVDMPKFLSCLDKDYKHRFALPEILPGGSWCMMSSLPDSARPFMGPNCYLTPGGGYTQVHQDGHGTVDSGHSNLAGFNEVIMLRRLPECHKIQACRAIPTLSGNQTRHDAINMLYRLPHDDGRVEIAAWPTFETIEEWKRLNYYPSVFILKPGQHVHINKGRLHAFRKLTCDTLSPDDCHSKLRADIIKEYDLKQSPICLSVAFDWMYWGYDKDGINREVASIIECASLCRKYRCKSLAVPETVLLNTAMLLVGRLDKEESQDPPILGFHATAVENLSVKVPEIDKIAGMLPSLKYIYKRDKAATNSASLDKSVPLYKGVKLKISKKPDTFHDPLIYPTDPWGSDYFCMICNQELSNVYFHCNGCEKALNRDFNICSQCYSEGQYLKKIQIHPTSNKWYSDVNHLGNNVFHNQSRGCTCHAGRCRTCVEPLCKSCSCKCHKEFTNQFRFIEPEAVENVLKKCENLVTGIEVKYSRQTEARLDRKPFYIPVITGKGK